LSRSFQAHITENRFILPDTILLKLRPDESSMHPEPGQFYMLQAGHSLDPLLKRPFCFFDNEEEELYFLIRVKGKGTKVLSSMGIDETISVVGPLGRAYPLSAKKPLVVIGGIGVASLYPVVKKLSGKARVIYGARNHSELIFADRIGLYAESLLLFTDDGSVGEKGLVTSGLERELGKDNDVEVFSCGPDVMLKKVSDICLDRGIECFISLEKNMACGIGSCLGCTVKTLDGYKRVCAEGPVFSAKDIVWE